jgi:hypothetical protein
MFWNLDTGLVVFVALTAFLALIPANFVRVRVFRAAAAMVGALSALLLISVALYLRAGAFVDPTASLHSLRVFYLLGFMMLPMPGFPHVWMAAVLLSAVTIAVAAVYHLENNSEWELAGFVALLGAGLFSYYNGRSHGQVFILESWPFVVLTMFLIDRANRQWTIVTSAIAAIGLGVIIGATPAVIRIASERWRSIVMQSDRSPIIDDALFIRGATSGLETVAVLAQYQASLLAEAKESPPHQASRNLQPMTTRRH